MTQPNRMPSPHAADFSAPQIDPAAPVTFRLDGRRLTGFAGDTVLSALLANGIDIVGIHMGHPLALDETTAPPIALKGNEGQPDLSMPMALCPIVEGAEFITCAPKRIRTTLGKTLGALGTLPASLDLDLARGLPPVMPWIAGTPEVRVSADVAIVGGGLAGMAAALRACARGARAVLIERAPRLGGLAEYFGKVEGEATPRDMIGTLVGDLAGHEDAALYLGTEAFDLVDGQVHAIRVVVENGIPRPQRIAVGARHIVLATGEDERLPIFPGNRLPGVFRSAFAWRMASRYSLWRGASAHVHSTTNAGYRMALLGADCGKEIRRASDPRGNPQTRFIEFAKAYGFPLGWGVRIDAVTARDRGLAIRHADAATGRPAQGGVEADGLMVSGGWQPDLTLWLRAGGKAQWQASRECLVPKGHMAGVVFAGSAAGYKSQTGCVQSGEAAIDALFSGRMRDISDPQIAPVFETPDGPLTIARPAQRGEPPAYLAPGATLNALPAPRETGLRAIFLRAGPPSQAVTDRALAPLEAASAVHAGLVPTEAASLLCRERVILPRGFPGPPGTRTTGAPMPDALPAFLFGRFGARQTLWTLTPAAKRAFGPGCMVFVNSDDADPAQAIGVVVSQEGPATQALIGTGYLKRGDTAFIRDGLVAVPATLAERIKSD
ncbi:FAD-dependent oxidoreductase [Pelagibacterium xiamenense]|uniref:FAD-dependent oxidoreductase n=1 Tax=Pelagibacterium xiamenense TaxID=2901140 RepID=UPI001E2B7537|nr:FAD-dependent oxidoreductase [Pelagibacterium xiamenense]MCD7059509.1 (2Fe-2S)-binding protein [Pelagibacterium xiamenense]